ncbi:TPA: hypothetical protein QDZ34_003313 [Stenotrophomonas maltophilia]|nr:hypothetical protein [Stenotrophomonas maltophilia]HDS1027602.1 hypothetical protein [Stenotrophomonas maltophilia]HDS1031102.1 hypothetical protein [Stenotrophomonas maltophilia]HDS1035936.1 hypothetical protein [Stenotrophomonas maltophilia]
MKTPMCWMILGWALAATAQAQTHVYKCVDGPHPVYQQTPCQGRAEWRWDVPAEASDARGGSAPASARKTEQRDSVRPARGRGSAAQAALITLARDPAGCERARSQHAKVLARPARLDYLQRRQLDDAVRAACQ